MEHLDNVVAELDEVKKKKDVEATYDYVKDINEGKVVPERVIHTVPLGSLPFSTFFVCTSNIWFTDLAFEL